MKNAILTNLILLLVVGLSYAQPANDNCAGAIDLTPLLTDPGVTDCFSVAAGDPAITTINTTLDATDSGVDGSCSTQGDDLWYSWTATTNALAWQYQSVGADPGIIVWSGACGALTEVQCVSTFTSNATLSGWDVGDQLFIQIYDFSNGAGLTFDFCLNAIEVCSFGTFEVLTYCEPGDESGFYIDVITSDLGSGNTAYDIDIAGPQGQVTAVGTTTYGPFPNGVPVDLTITGADDPDCSGGLTGLVADCACAVGAVEASASTVSCVGETVTLTADLGVVIPGEFLGYTEDQACATAFMDISATGTALIPPLTDDGETGITTTSMYPFYDMLTNQFTVGTNGCISPGSLTANIFQTTFPSTTPLICPYGDDLDTDIGQIYWQEMGTMLIVQWDNIPHFSGAGDTDGATFQIKIDSATGVITFVYTDVEFMSDTSTFNDFGNSASIGINAGTMFGGDFIQSSNNDDALLMATSCVSYTPDETLPSTCDFIGWSADGGTTVFSTMNPAMPTPALGTTTYTAVVQCGDALCFDDVDVTVADGPTVTISEVAGIDCNGDATGELSAAATGGTAPYTYAWSAGPAGLAAGTYMVTATDANGCEGTASYTLTEPTAVVATCVDENVGCPSATGTGISVSATGGTAPYTYAWSNGATTMTVAGLGVGSYTATVTDANGCTAECTAMVTSDPDTTPPTLDCPMTGAGNLITDSGFDAGTGAWGFFGPGGLAGGPTEGNPPPSVFLFADPFSVSGMQQSFPCEGGDVVCMGADLFAPDPDGGGNTLIGTGIDVEVKVEFFDAGGNILNPPFGTILDVLDGATATANVWNTYSGCITAPPGTASVNAVVIVVNFGGPDDNGAVLVDNVTLEKQGPQLIEAGIGCFADVDIPVITATDNCDIASIVLSGDATATGIASYGIGEYEVIYTVTDDSGNSSTCSYEFIVEDTTPPTVACPDFGILEPLVNGDFATGDLTGWSQFGPGYTHFVDPGIGNGAPSYKLFGPFDGSVVAGSTQNLPCPAGETVCLSGDMFTPSFDAIAGSQNFVELKLEFLDAGGNIINGPFGTPIGVITGSDPVDTWLSYEGCLTAPAGTVSVNVVIIFVQPAFEGGAVWTDNVVLQKGEAEIIDADAGNCMALVEIPDLSASATDECGIASVSVSGDANAPGFDLYEPGEYSVDYVITDMNGNETMCNYSFEVVDLSTPEFDLTPINECSGVPLAIDLDALITNGVTGVTYVWDALNNPFTLGESLPNQTSSMITDVITNNPTTNPNGDTQTITYRITATSANGCELDEFILEVNIFPEIQAETACACAINSAGTQVVPLVTIGNLSGGSAVDDGLPYTFTSNDGVFLSSTAGIGGSTAMELNNINGGPYTITVTDNFGCETILTGTCNLDCAYSDIGLIDPCSCNNDQSENGAMDGTFTETVVVVGPGGFFLLVGAGSTGSGVVVGTPIAQVTANPMATYEYEFTHTDNEGYTIFVDLLLPNGTTVPLIDPAGNQLTISNVCQYPILDDPVIDAVDFCETDEAISVLGATSEIQGHDGTIITTVNGATITSFDPSAFGPGQHLIQWTFFGDFESNQGGTVGAPAIPGCQTSVFQQVTVHSGGQLNCNDHVTISLDENCSLGPLNAGAFMEGGALNQFFGYRILDALGNPIADSDLPAYVGQTLEYEVFDACSGNVCWGTVTLEDKIAPTIDCECETPYLADGVTPNPDCTFKCYEVWDLEELEDLQRGNNEVLPDADNNEPEDNCLSFGDPVIVFSYDDGPNCGEQIVTREMLWTYVDFEGQTQYLTCTQNFLFDNLELSSIGSTENGTWDGYPDIFTANSGDRPLSDLYTPAMVVNLSCGAGTDPADIAAAYDIDTPGRPAGIDRDDHSQTPNLVEHNEGIPYAYPYVVQGGWAGRFHAKPIDNNICNMYQTYSDLSYDACAEDCFGNSKIARTWTILDWCTASTVDFVQTIKRIDTEGPAVSGPDFTVSVDPWGCAANFEVPAPEHLLDNCDKETSWSVLGPLGVEIVNGVALDLPKGTTTLTYVAEDCCGNQSFFSFNVTVVDETAPTAIALQNIVLQLSNNQSGDGEAKLYARDLDNFSHDGCTDIHFEVRRADSNDWCHVGNSTFNNDGHAGDSDDDNDNGEYVIFCCEDAIDVDSNGVSFGIHDVLLRVWDDGDMDGVFGTEGDNYNEVWTTVKVEDKSEPVVVCPPHIELSCNEDYLNYELTGRPYGFSTCGDIVCDMEPSDNFRSKNASQPPFVGEAIPAYNPSCRRGAIQRTWSCEGKTCTQWIIMRDTEDGDLEITWPEDKESDCIDIDAGEPDIVERLCELSGTSLESDTFYFEDGACYKILNHWTVINWCDYDADDTDLNDQTDDDDDGFVPGLYTHTQVLKLIDTEKPTITTQDSCFAVNADCVGEGIQIWAGGADNGICSSAWLKWEAEVDMNSDWVVDYTFSSWFAPDDPFYIAPTAGDVHIDLPDGLPNGCASTHRVRWTVSDGCGNDTQATSFFTIEDKKKPTPYMLNLSTALMADGSVELWASDFDTGSFDNCSPQDFLLFTFSSTVPPQLLDPEEEDPWYDADGVASENDYNNGNAELWDGEAGTSAMVFTDEDLAAAEANGGLLEVPVYVWDLCGNSDFAIVNLQLVDNGGSANIEGRVATEAGIGVEGVTMTATSAQAGYPATTMTEADGEYMFEFNPMYNDYTLTGEKNDDWLNGVTTLDILLIQRHILSIEELDSPYKMIAADASNDEKISAVDLIQLRKLILGLTSELPNNDSWRFTDADASMDSSNPWPFSEFVNVTDLQSNMVENFVATKVGDVNGSVELFLQGHSTDTRSGASLNMNIEQSALAQGITELRFKSSNFSEISGFQFTLEANVTEIVELTSGLLTIEEGNVGLVDGALTMSWNTSKMVSYGEDVLFTLKVKKSDSKVSLSDRITQTEAYQGSGFEAINLILEEAELAINSLGQNEPNPWRAETVINFSLAEAGTASITVYDVTGKVLFVTEADYTAGTHEVNLKGRDLTGAAGVLYYKLESGEFSDTKKMILIE